MESSIILELIGEASIIFQRKPVTRKDHITISGEQALFLMYAGITAIWLQKVFQHASLSNDQIHIKLVFLAKMIFQLIKKKWKFNVPEKWNYH